jgi:hypothetical protein
MFTTRGAIRRREFFKISAAGLGGLAVPWLRGDESAARRHTLTVIAGTPRERGKQYGRQFKDGIAIWLEDTLARRKSSKPDELYRFAAACGQEVNKYSPAVSEELQGVAEGAGCNLEEILMLACHEELWQGGLLPATEHCHAVAVGPPCTTGDSFIAETYDFFGPTQSHLIQWNRKEGPRLIAYGFPGLWISIGMNSAGLALGATSVLSPGKEIQGPRVGIPYYVWAAHVLSQSTLSGALEESRRARHAGWWTAVLADATGELANVEVRREEVVIETGRGHIARHQYGSRRMTGTADGNVVKLQGKAPEIVACISSNHGKVDDRTLMKLTEQVGATHDLIVFNATRGAVHIRRTQGVLTLPWQTFRLE